MLFFGCSFGQNKPIEIQIDSITSKESADLSEREFTISFHIKNLTKNEVSFFLNPNLLVPHMRSSMTRNVIYKLYQNEEFMDLENVFVNPRMYSFRKLMAIQKTQKEKDSVLKLFLKNELKVDIDSIKNSSENSTIINDKKYSKELLNSICILKPFEKKTYNLNFFWDKNRYYKIDDNEFYLNEDASHQIELYINLLKDEYENKLPEKEFKLIMNNPNFIKGDFFSNKTEIILKNKKIPTIN